MTTTVELPLRGGPQTLGFMLKAMQYRAKLSWNAIAECWILDIADNTDTPIINGIALVTGADLLEQFQYLNFGGMLYVINDIAPVDAVPGWNDLGQTGHVYFTTPV
jgi:hypothetical protein